MVIASGDILRGVFGSAALVALVTSTLSEEGSGVLLTIPTHSAEFAERVVIHHSCGSLFAASATAFEKTQVLTANLHTGALPLFYER